MVKASWGTKRTCQNCAARFYDLNKSPIKCPKCGREHDREDFVKVRRGRQTAAATAAEPTCAAPYLQTTSNVNSMQVDPAYEIYPTTQPGADTNSVDQNVILPIPGSPDRYLLGPSEINGQEVNGRAVGRTRRVQDGLEDEGRGQRQYGHPLGAPAGCPPFVEGLSIEIGQLLPWGGMPQSHGHPRCR